MFQTNTFENRITVFIYPPQKIWCVRYKEVRLAWIFHAVPKTVPTVTIVSYKSFRYIGVFLREFDCDLAASTKKCPLLQSVRYRQVLLYQKQSSENTFFHFIRGVSRTISNI